MDKYQVLKQYFGYEEFREGQEGLIDSILAGRDTLGIMPTGAGKSLCFQVPALMMKGITLVISPLISLMQDQVSALNQAGIHAAYLNSSLTVNQYYKALSYAREGRYPIIYVAPERLVTEEFLDFAIHAEIAMVVVDEAHCVSQWGQDFRPSYLKIMEFIDKLPKRPDRERLRRMTYYCFTNECLRDYILRYFGEYGGNYCGNCSNCLSQFETVDVTEVAEAVIGCVEDCRQRYGVNVILDTVRGASTAKIRQYRMDENAWYAKLDKVPAFKLRQVMNYLLLNEYLRVTNDEYMLVKLTEKSQSVLNGDEQVIMKMAKEQIPAREKSGKKKGRKSIAAVPGGAEFSGVEEKLFECLRTLRFEIAKEEKVPPYIVFSDKTLSHMCIVKPETRAEMLQVSGVGEFKYEKYGERFLACVRENMEI